MTYVWFIHPYDYKSVSILSSTTETLALKVWYIRMDKVKPQAKQVQDHILSALISVRFAGLHRFWVEITKVEPTLV